MLPSGCADRMTSDNIITFKQPQPLPAHWSWYSESSANWVSKSSAITWPWPRQYHLEPFFKKYIYTYINIYLCVTWRFVNIHKYTCPGALTKSLHPGSFSHDEHFCCLGWGVRFTSLERGSVVFHISACLKEGAPFHPSRDNNWLQMIDKTSLLEELLSASGYSSLLFSLFGAVGYSGWRYIMYVSTDMPTINHSWSCFRV